MQSPATISRAPARHVPPEGNDASRPSPPAPLPPSLWFVALVAPFVMSTASCAADRPAVAPHTRVVTIENFLYEPESVTVAVGDTIEWHNQDIVPHTATSGGTFDTGSIAASQDGRWVATRGGTFDYVCTFHPTMKGTVVVQ